MLIPSECVSSYQMQYYWHFDAVHNLLFLALFACGCETHIPRKLPESENFYEILRSRTFVKFRINTGFTASCFFGTLLVAFAQIKDFYISIRCSATIVSTWLDRSGLMSVIGNLFRLIWYVSKYLRLFVETYQQILWQKYLDTFCYPYRCLNLVRPRK